jgi:hypothetical protein
MQSGRRKSDYMTPGPATQYTVNRADGYTEPFGNSLLREGFPENPDKSDIRFGQFSSGAVTCPAFFSGISHIVRMSADEQMIRANAERSIASMADMFSFWDWSGCKFPGKPVGIAFYFLAVLLERQISVAAFPRSRPKPASVCLANVNPEPVGNRNPVTDCHALLTAITPASVGNVRRRNGELFSAAGAFASDRHNVIISNMWRCVQ